MTTSQKATAELPVIRHALMPSNHAGKSYSQPSRAKQSFRDECDINKIMSQYRDTGTLAHLNNSPGHYDDLGNSGDYHDAMNLITQAQQSFAELPSDIRDRFNNDPASFLEFVSDPDNQDELRDLGLINPQETHLDQPAAVSAEPVETPPQEPPEGPGGDP